MAKQPIGVSLNRKRSLSTGTEPSDSERSMNDASTSGIRLRRNPFQPNTLSLAVLTQTVIKFFRSPKSRRLHLIDFHKYPTTFYFSLPNHGLNDLYKKYGSGVSLLRPTWNPRPDGSKPPLTGETHSEHDVLKQKITDRKDGLRKNYGNIRERLKNDDAVDEVKIKSEAKEEDLLAEAMEKISLVPRKVLLKQRDHQKNQCT
ncbi:hypothetical protein BY996DRAFT_6411192 [Phakopsora pachyrhizi]|nr:hypothetical protein BY996DRAFT_6411192 [Phakopsora pachyrhizi]